jgi:hypothetical protein
MVLMHGSAPGAPLAFGELVSRNQLDRLDRTRRGIRPHRRPGRTQAVGLSIGTDLYGGRDLHRVAVAGELKAVVRLVVPNEDLVATAGTDDFLRASERNTVRQWLAGHGERRGEPTGYQGDEGDESMLSHGGHVMGSSRIG